MNISIDRARCQRHGQCIIAAPDVFCFDGEGKPQLKAGVTGALRKDAEAAADACPEQAITVGD